MTRIVQICASALALMGVATGIYFQGSWLQQVLSLAAAIYVLAPAFLVLAVLVFGKFLKRDPLGRGLKTAVLLWLLCAGSLALSYGGGTGIRLWRANATRSYVAQVMPLLDEMKGKTGAYPEVLPDSLNAKASVWSYAISYSSDGKTFRFAYDDSAGLMNAYELYSSERVWHYYSA
jgi:hypothetical protein